MNWELVKKDGKDMLCIVIDVSADAVAKAVPSASGKSKVIASTHGNKAIGLPGGKVAHLGLNFYTR